MLRMLRITENTSVALHIHIDGPLVLALVNYYDGLPTSYNEVLRELFQTGVSLRWQGLHEDAIIVFRRALALQTSDEERVGLLVLIGNCFFEQGRFEEAHGHYKEAERISEESIISEGIVASKAMLAYLYLIRGDKEIASTYEAQVAAAAIDLPTRGRDAIVLQVAARNLAGILCIEAGEFALALAAFDEALNYASEAGCPKAFLDPLFGKGLAYLHQREWEKAADRFREALDIAKDAGMSFAKATIIEGLAHAYEGAGDIALAIAYHREAILILEPTSNRELVRLISERLAKLEGEGDFVSLALFDHFRR
jgi:tetratricopeptide (TPR) repeat protein